ncbi:MAG: TonB-dependent receptor domain-containing protein, partial [Terriglobales bacterium]
FNQTINANPFSRAYQANFNEFDQISQKEWGLFFSDSWHVTPALTFNYGLRYEYEGVPLDDLNKYTVPVGGAAGVFGISGMGNIFKPGTETGSVTQFINDKGQPFYKGYNNGWAPSLGLAWTPNFKGGLLQSLFGANGKSVLRAGYSIAYDRQGLSEFTSMAPSNPGASNNAFLTAVGTVKNPGDFNAGSIQFQSGAVTSAAQEETQPFGAQISVNPGFGDSVNATDPGLAQPMVQSWQLGIQRQLDRNTALEVRYVGNHATRGWTSGGLNENEVNIFENGFLGEFNNALNNLNVCNSTHSAFVAAGKPAGGTDCGSSSFANLGLPGQKNVPIFTAAFTGNTAGSQTNSSFRNGTFISDLQSG